MDHKFITGFEYYLKTTRKCAHNSAIKYITNFKKIIRIAYANDWIDKDFRIPRLDQVRDIFIFCCFTGLAYADVKKLTNDNLITGVDREQWIETRRSKTDTRSNIPILPIAKTIIDKYKDDPTLEERNLVLPVLSNQKMNAYIKEIADVCDIKKNLTFHLARHTFATTVTLTNGVPIESVSKMLGHTNLKTTQHYAKILDMKVGNDMQLLKQRLATQEKMQNSKDSSLHKLQGFNKSQEALLILDIFNYCCPIKVESTELWA